MGTEKVSESPCIVVFAKFSQISSLPVFFLVTQGSPNSAGCCHVIKHASLFGTLTCLDVGYNCYIDRIVLHTITVDTHQPLFF